MKEFPLTPQLKVEFILLYAKGVKRLMTMIIFYAFLILAYLLGSLSSAIITCKIMGLGDPRDAGSGNPGATNVLRLGGKKAALITLLGDVLKGFIPVLLARFLGLEGFYLSLIAFAAFLGHLFPIFFRFQGGKGVSTVIGCLFALSWILGLLFIGTWLLVALISRYSSLSALIAALTMPFYAYFLGHVDYCAALSAMSLILILRHHENIRRLVKGKEGKIKLRKS